MNKLTILFAMFLLFSSLLIIDIAYKPTKIVIKTNNITTECECDYNYCANMMMYYKDQVHNFSKCYNGYCDQE